MNLYLVRHASYDKHNPEKSLSPEGREEIKLTANHLKYKEIQQVSVIYHSGKTRARQTAEIISRFINPTEGLITAEDLDPMDPPQVWDEKLSGTNDDIMLVGHLPFMANLAEHLLGEKFNNKDIDFKAATIVCLSKQNGGGWEHKWTLSPWMLN